MSQLVGGVLQKPVSTNRKYIRGSIGRVSKHIPALPAGRFAKPLTNNPYTIDVPSIG
jgi:hypothetical protein